MRSELAERLGVQTPQIVHLPPDVHSLAAAEDAIELADRYGICDGYPLDEAQKFVIRAAMGQRIDETWAAATVAHFMSRQNGKNDVVAAREFAGLLLFGEGLIIHTAHLVPTAVEAFNRLVAVFENYDDLRRQVRVRYANGEQAIQVIKTGQRLMYKARSGGSGRGYAKADLVVYDEAQHLQAEHLAASGPTRLANPNSQSWYLGSGGLTTSVNAWRLRRRALEGDGGRFAYVEFTAEDVELVGGQIVSILPDALDREAWARANPAYGYRISDEAMLGLYDELGADLFGRECLCLWEPEPGSDTIFLHGAWQAVCGEHVAPSGFVTLGVDVNPERTRAAIVAADPEGRVEVVDYRAGTGWVAGRAAELQRKHHTTVAVDNSGPAKSLIPALEEAGAVVTKVPDLSAACAFFYDRVAEGQLAVLRSPELDEAVKGAQRKVTGDTWRWARRSATVDLSPLVAATVAVWVAGQGGIDVSSQVW